MAKYLLIFSVRSSGIRDHSVEKIIDCDKEELLKEIAWHKETLNKVTMAEQGPYINLSDSSDSRKSWVDIATIQVLPL